MGYTVFAKVRLADIIEPNTNKKKWFAAFAKIKSKHIDFLLCDNKYFSPILAIELDDNSHNEQKRIERDNFVNTAFLSAKIPILRLKGSMELKDTIKNALKPKDNN